MENAYFCGSELRREKVRAKGILNGIDYLEVDHPAQTTLTVTFLRSLPALTAGNFRIEGGVRIRDIRVTNVLISANEAILTVDKRGDFSAYVLRVVAGPGNDTPPAGFDGHLSEVEFSFKVQCPSDFDCRPDPDCPDEPGETAVIDYLAKDYASFRRLMLDRMTVTSPDWRERNPSDMIVAVVEALAYVGDHLSYFQDSVATEAYLGTARRRTSVRRHARLLDYYVHEGSNARTFVCLEVQKASAADGVVLQKKRPFLDASLGEGAQVLTTNLDPNLVMPLVFESMHDLTLSSFKNRIPFHTWSDLDCCLPKGAIRATLRREAGLVLRPGDLLAFYETPIWRKVKDVLNPDNAKWECAEVNAVPNGTGTACFRMVREEAPVQRHVVRLRTVTEGHDAHEGVDIYEITWYAEDALPFPLCLSLTQDGITYEGVSVACGNVVLADHGQTLPNEPLIPDRPRPGEAYLPTLKATDLTFASPYSHATAVRESASSALRNDPHGAVAALTLRSGTLEWEVVADLLRSGPFDPHVVVEAETDRSARIRFGDDVNGMEPNPIDSFAVTPRVGGGISGNIGRGVLVRVVFDTPGITNVWNPLPGFGGVAPEPLEEVRQYAPEAYKVQERAVTEVDYARIAERHAEVQAALATFRWTGSWYTVFLVVDRMGGASVTGDPDFRESLLRHMDRYRMAGVDLELREPVFVPLEIVLQVCVANGYFRSDVHRRLLRAFGDFFHPDNFTFGGDVYLSQVLCIAMAIDGVDHVRPLTFKRWAQTANGEIANGRLSIARSEIAMLANDPSFPENGRISFELEGGL